MPAKRHDKKKEQQEEDERPVDEQGAYIFEAHGHATYDGQVQRRDGVVRRHGAGTFRDERFTYTGDWRDDAMHCDAAVVRFASGAVYEGAVVDGKFDGRGAFRWPDGSCYAGQWRANRMHGEGTYTDRDGLAWTGRFYNGTGPGLRQPLTTPDVGGSALQ